MARLIDAEREAPPCCAHLRITYRTEPVDGPNIRNVMVPGFAVRGWWECDSGCGTRFAAAPSLAGEREHRLEMALREAAHFLLHNGHRDAYRAAAAVLFPAPPPPEEGA